MRQNTTTLLVDQKLGIKSKLLRGWKYNWQSQHIYRTSMSTKNNITLKAIRPESEKANVLLKFHESQSNKQYVGICSPLGVSLSRNRKNAY